MMVYFLSVFSISFALYLPGSSYCYLYSPSSVEKFSFQFQNRAPQIPAKANLEAECFDL